MKSSVFLRSLLAAPIITGLSLFSAEGLAESSFLFNNVIRHSQVAVLGHLATRVGPSFFASGEVIEIGEDFSSIDIDLNQFMVYGCKTDLLWNPEKMCRGDYYLGRSYPQLVYFSWSEQYIYSLTSLDHIQYSDESGDPIEERELLLLRPIESTEDSYNQRITSGSQVCFWEWETKKTNIEGKITFKKTGKLLYSSTNVGQIYKSQTHKTVLFLDDTLSAEVTPHGIACENNIFGKLWLKSKNKDYMVIEVDHSKAPEKNPGALF